MAKFEIYTDEWQIQWLTEKETYCNACNRRNQHCWQHVYLTGTPYDPNSHADLPHSSSSEDDDDQDEEEPLPRSFYMGESQTFITLSITDGQADTAATRHNSTTACHTGNTNCSCPSGASTASCYAPRVTLRAGMTATPTPTRITPRSSAATSLTWVM